MQCFLQVPSAQGKPCWALLTVKVTLVSPKTHTSPRVCIPEEEVLELFTRRPRTVENQRCKVTFLWPQLVMTCEHIPFAQLGFS